MKRSIVAIVLATACAGGCAALNAADSDTLDDDTSSNGSTADDSDSSTQGVDVLGAWVEITAWAFWMGSPDGACSPEYPGGVACIPENGRDPDEQIHYVALTYDFSIMETEVTQAQFEAVMKNNPAYFGPKGEGPDCGETCPVESVTWYDALAYANQLSFINELEPCYTLTNVVCLEGTKPSVGSGYMDCFDGDSVSKGGIASASVVLYLVDKPQDCPAYRLPTESEWEYAARAETLSALPTGGLSTTSCDLDLNLDAIAWYCGNSTTSTNPVAQKDPNGWGLHDMLGNVSEWTWDLYEAGYPASSLAQPLKDPAGPISGATRVARGGSFSDIASAARSSARDGSPSPSYRSSSLGFRLVRTAPHEIDTDTAI